MVKVFTILVLSLTLIACEKPDRTVRNYKEIRFAKTESPAVRAAASEAPAASPAVIAEPPRAGGAASRQMGDLPPEALGDKISLMWSAPAGWEDLGPSGIRITTLRVQGQECTILSFPGDVGGDEANIRRWLGQINQNPPDDAVKQLVNAPRTLISEGGFEVRLYDFADILPATAPVGTLAGIFRVGEQTVFVKFTGESSILAAQKSAFEELCQTMRLRAGGAY
jgi:hypothetical protein